MKIEFKRASLSFALLCTLLVPAAAHAADAPALTRGEFIRLLASEVKLTPPIGSKVLMGDVDERFYADSSEVLTRLKALNGYEDGTLRLNQPITREHAAYIVGRLLGISDDEAVTALQERFGVQLSDGAPTADDALALIRTALRNDDSAEEWMEDARTRHTEVVSYRSETSLDMNLMFKPSASPQGPDVMSLRTNAHVDFNKYQGFQYTATTKIGEDDSAKTVDTEQIMTDKGSFMKLPLSPGAKAEWYDVSSLMEISFSEAIELFMNRLDISKLIQPYFFYRDLGVTEKNGRKVHTFSMNGKMNDASELLETLNEEPGTSEMLRQLVQNWKLAHKSMSMSSVMAYDEISKLPISITTQYRITNDDSSIPIDQLKFTMTLEVKDYNQAIEITVPEEVKQAKPYPVTAAGEPVAP